MAVINTNYLALVAQNNLTKSQSSLSTAIQRLSSGLRINSDKDNAMYDMASRFSERDKTLSTIRFAQKNAQDTTAVMQTADGALREGVNNLQRMRELMLHSASSSGLTQEDRASIQLEIDNHLRYFGEVMGSVEYNSHKLFDGSFELVTVSGREKDRSITFGDFRLEALGLENLSANTEENARQGITQIDVALERINSESSKIFEETNVVVTELYENLRNITAQSNAQELQNLSSSRILDTESAFEMSKLTRAQILQQAGTSVLAQANSLPQIAFSLLR